MLVDLEFVPSIISAIAAAVVAVVGNNLRRDIANNRTEHEKQLEVLRSELAVLAAAQVNSRKSYDDLRFRYAVEIIEEYVTLNEAVYDFDWAIRRVLGEYSRGEGPDGQPAVDAEHDEQAALDTLLEARNRFLAMFRARRVLLPSELTSVVASAMSTLDGCLSSHDIDDRLHDELTRAAEEMAAGMRTMLGLH